MMVALSKASPELAGRYFSDGEGTQVVLTVPDEESLLRLHASASGHNFPTSIVIEDGKLMAIGLGPVAREIARPFVKGLRLMA